MSRGGGVGKRKRRIPYFFRVWGGGNAFNLCKEGGKDGSEGWGGTHMERVFWQKSDQFLDGKEEDLLA